MKKLFFAVLIAFSACNNNSENTTPDKKSDSANNEQAASMPGNATAEKSTPAAEPKVYANKRFKDVTVEKIDSNRYRVKGKGQIFEASFGWVIEDGHKELAQGFANTDAGAPAWGSFDFTVEAKKIRPNSTLHLILFETSAKDGSRVYVLPIPLN